MNEASRETGVDQASISKMARGLKGETRGWRASFATDVDPLETDAKEPRNDGC